jgi:rhodanese-related sulfurtransferase
MRQDIIVRPVSELSEKELNYIIICRIGNRNKYVLEALLFMTEVWNLDCFLTDCC